MLPPSILGFLKGRSAYAAAYENQLWLESKGLGRSPKAGVTLDLVKCYNLVFRPKLSLTSWHATIRLGWSFTQQGTLLTGDFIQLDFCTCSTLEIKKNMEYESLDLPSRFVLHTAVFPLGVPTCWPNFISAGFSQSLSLLCNQPDSSTIAS